MQTNRLKTSQIVLYGFFGMFLNTFYLMFLAYYRLFYLTNVLQLSATVAALVNSLSTWGNVATMMLGGIIIDKINFKTGKYRTWALVGGVVMGLVFPLLFANLGLSQSAAGVLFVVVFIVQSLGYNTLWVAERSLVGPMSSCAEDANSLAMSAQQASTLGGLVFGVVNTPIMNMLNNSYTLTAVLYGLFILGGTVGIFFLAKNYDNAPAKVVEKGPAAPKASFGDAVKATGSTLIIFIVAMILNNCHLGFFMALLNYFTTYVLNDPAALSLSVTLGSLAGLVGAWLSKVMCDKIGKKNAFIYFSLLTGVLYLLIALIGKTSVPFLIIRTAIGCFSVVGGMLIMLFANDIADNTEMKTGTDAYRATIQSVAGTCIRLGTALSTTVASFGLAAVGYDATNVTEPVIKAITNLMAYGPFAVCALSAVIFFLYKIDEGALNQFRAEKAAKRAAAQQ